MATVLITGASRGIGLELTRQYAAAGDRVIATCRKPDGATGLQALAGRYAGRVQIEALDVTDHAAVDALAARLAGTVIDILINNAGDIGPRDPDRTRLVEQRFGTLNYAEWRRVLDINMLAPIKVAEAFAAHVAAARRPRMIFVSSTTGSNVEGQYPLFLYCSSKAGLNKCVTMLALALRGRGITCLAVCPGHVRTELGGDGAVLEVAESVRGLREVIDAAGPDRSGQFLRYNGETIAW
jgi:NAD(P)-dependent dehydrogenase (short-subunit alcohol dehydrogenase family)